jgi:Fatty acid desaturase
MQVGVWRSSQRDSLFVMAAAVHAVILIRWPAPPLIALGLWWNANTIAHNFIHRPFFRAAVVNRLFSAALSVLLGIPQTLWRDRHLAHHAGVEWRLRISRQLVIETSLVLSLWIALALRQPRFFLLMYLPGYLGGLALCALQGHWEHAGGRPTSHYGSIYNRLCFNDGYHAEHHANPSLHWTTLPQRLEPGAATSAWPAPLRWLDLPFLEVPFLEALERLVLRSQWLQRTVLQSHRRAFLVLLPELNNIRSVLIVGGGLYPRTALILRALLPAARLTIMDANSGNLEIARAQLGEGVDYRQERFGNHASGDFDLTVFPLSYAGDRAAIYRHPPSATVVVHDWIWSRRGARGSVVSIALLKRLNLVQQ